MSKLRIFLFARFLKIEVLFFVEKFDFSSQLDKLLFQVEESVWKK